MGEQVEGYSNFLWGVVAWIGMHLGAEPIYFTQWVSIAAQAATLLIVYRIGLVATGSRTRALLAPGEPQWCSCARSTRRIVNRSSGRKKFEP